MLSEAGQQKLKESAALITRVGGMGGPASLMLTMAGVIVRRRDQNRILYTLRDERVRTMIEFLRVEFMETEQKALV